MFRNGRSFLSTVHRVRPGKQEQQAMRLGAVFVSVKFSTHVAAYFLVCSFSPVVIRRLGISKSQARVERSVPSVKGLGLPAGMDLKWRAHSTRSWGIRFD